MTREGLPPGNGGKPLKNGRLVILGKGALLDWLYLDKLNRRSCIFMSYFVFFNGLFFILVAKS